MKKSRFFFVALAAVLAVGAWNYFGAQRPVVEALAKDVRNEKLTLWAHYRYGVQPDTLVLDLRGFSPEAAHVDIMRAVLHSAVAMKDERFEHIILAYKGTPKFQLEGTYFHTLGIEYEQQNPVYTLRTFPEHVFRLDGKQAYATWTGGWLGVVGKQMEDLNQFAKDWYLDDAVREHVDTQVQPGERP